MDINDNCGIVALIILGLVYFRMRDLAMKERAGESAQKSQKMRPLEANRKPWQQIQQPPQPAEIQFYRENIYGQWEADGKKRLDLAETGLLADWKLFVTYDQIRKMAVMRLPVSGQRLLRIDYDSAEGEPQTVGLALSEFGLRDWGLSLQGHTGLWVENLEGRKKKAANGEDAGEL